MVKLLAYMFGKRFIAFITHKSRGFRTSHLLHLYLVNATYHFLCRLEVSEEFPFVIPPRLHKVSFGLRYRLGPSLLFGLVFLEGFNFLFVLPILLDQLFDFLS